MGAVFCGWYLPAGQAVQTMLSVRTPTKQLRGLLPLEVSKPASQAGAQVAPERSVAGQVPGLPLVGGRLASSQGIVKHWEAAVAPAAGVVSPAAQAWHWASEERPVWAENLPAEQSWSHTAIEVCPAPATENLPAAQAWHWASEERPAIFDHLPAEQRPVHWSATSPVSMAHFPAGQ